MLGMTIQERLSYYAIPVTESGCWLWTGYCLRGYARVHYNRKSWPAHRVVYLLKHGKLTPGMTIDHLCRVKCCVNPDHLEEVTNKENVLRGVGVTAINAKRTHCKRGHEFTPDNTKRTKLGRVCKTCMSIRQRGGA